MVTRILRLTKRIPKNITIGIRNCIRWFPVIWTDRDFDYGYLLDIMDKKLKYMEKFFRSGKTWSEGSEKRANQITALRKRIEDIEEEVWMNKFEVTDKDSVYRAEAEYDRIMEDFVWILRYRLRDWWD